MWFTSSHGKKIAIGTILSHFGALSNHSALVSGGACLYWYDECPWVNAFLCSFVFKLKERRTSPAIAIRSATMHQSEDNNTYNNTDYSKSMKEKRCMYTAMDGIDYCLGTCQKSPSTYGLGLSERFPPNNKSLQLPLGTLALRKFPKFSLNTPFRRTIVNLCQCKTIPTNMEVFGSHFE